MLFDRKHIDILCVHPLSCEQRSFSVEALSVRGKGLAVTPFKEAGLPLVPLDQSEQWVLTHQASGRQVGDSFPMEIKSGLRSIETTVVVRSVLSGGSGVEFVHMRQEDREKLRRLLRGLADD